MSVQRLDSQRSFYHTSFVCDELFGSADRYRLFREKILPQLLTLRSQLETLYCESNGRPAIDPVLLCGVTLLQFMEKVSDRRAAEQVAYHLGWKYALDLELPYEGFHPTVLVYFRDRLEEKKAERVIFDGIVGLLIELGLIKRAGKQRIDSTHILGYVKEMSRLECAVETLRLALEGLAGVVGGKRPEFWERLWSLYVQSEVGWRLSKAERDSRYRQCGQDMKEILEWIDKNDPKLSEMESIKLLRRVFGEQFEVIEATVQSRRTRPSRSVQNPHDPDAHYADKGNKQWIGYKVHVVESVEPEQPAKVKAEPGEHFITEIVTVEAAENEKTGLAEALKRQQQHHEIRPPTIYADAGYVTESTLAQAEAKRHGALGADPSRSPQGAVQCRWVCCRCGKPAGGLSAGKDQHSMQPYQGQLHGNRVLPSGVGQSMRLMSGADTMHARQERAENPGGWLTSRSGREAAQGDETGRVLPIDVSEKRHRGNPQRVGAWPWAETDEVSRTEPSQPVALLHGRGLQRETIFKTAGLRDRNDGSEPRVRVQV